jgi:hypothetical protein
MALHYANLDKSTREYMLQEIVEDRWQGKLMIDPRLNDDGIEDYPDLLEDAARSHDDEWLAQELRRRGYIKGVESRRTRSGGTTIARVPATAADTLAEGQFNRYYMRGLCLRAMAEEIKQLEVYRAKKATRPRPESEAMVGQSVPVVVVLDYLRRSQGVEPAVGLAPGPNSGLSLRLPDS